MSATDRVTGSPAAQTILAGVVFVGSLVALVVLTLADKPTEALMALAGPAVLALIVSGEVRSTSKRQARQLETIEQQTNGRLSARDAKIDDLTHKLLEATARAEAAEARATATTPTA